LVTHDGASLAYKSTMFPHAAGGGTVTGTIVFPEIPVTVSDTELSSYLDKPEKGILPAPAISGSPAQYTGGAVAWEEAGGGVVSGAFADGTAYTATVTLTAKPGYTFAGVGNFTFIHKGNAAATVSQQDNNGSSITVIIKFPTLGSGMQLPPWD
jgi:hypothetical protein